MESIVSNKYNDAIVAKDLALLRGKVTRKMTRVSSRLLELAIINLIEKTTEIPKKGPNASEQS